jgi:hypothetical protein
MAEHGQNTRGLAMDEDIILVRTYQGKPAQMVAVAHAPGIIYASNPALVERVKSGASSAVGFPVEDVFCYDPKVHAELQALWETLGLLERSKWREVGVARYSSQ